MSPSKLALNTDFAFLRIPFESLYSLSAGVGQPSTSHPLPAIPQSAHTLAPHSPFSSSPSSPSFSPQLSKSPKPRGRKAKILESTVLNPKQKLFLCLIDGCNKVFKRNEHLIRHVRMHTGEKVTSILSLLTILTLHILHYTLLLTLQLTINSHSRAHTLRAIESLRVVTTWLHI